MLSDSAGWEETAPGEEPGPGPPWRRAEAALLARRIEQLIGSGAARAGEIVVLLRYATAAGVYGQALAARGLPIAAALGGGFYAAQEISDLGAYVRVLANPLDDIALYGVLASPLCGLGADGLATIGLASKRLRRPPWEVLVAAGSAEPAAVVALDGLSPRDAELVDAARRLIEGERRLVGGLGVAELVIRSGYAERALAGPGAELALANVRKLLRLARELEAREGRDLRGFADRLAAGRLGSSREQHAQLAETDAVRLMTVHAAKGLEFPVVCLADLGHGPPVGAPIILTDGARVGLRLPGLDGAKPAEAFAYAELRAERGNAAVAEEQRIAYVAMTRARERLILSGSAHFAHWPAAGPFAPAIAWLAPAVVADLPERLAGPTGVSELSLGGARVRLTLTAAGEMPALRDVVSPDLLPPAAHESAGPLAAESPGLPAPEPPGALALEPPGALAPRSPNAARRRRPAVEYEQISLFAELEPQNPEQADRRSAGLVPAAALAGTGSRQTMPAAPAAASLQPRPLAGVRAPPSPVSYSSLADYARCGYGYYLRRVVGLAPVAPPPGLEPAGSYDAAERGQIVHALLERLDFARPVVPPVEDVRAQAGGRELGAGELAAIVELTESFARSPLCARLAAAETIDREASFGLAVGDLLVNGYIDVLAGVGGGRMLVVDYKTDRVGPDTDLAGRVAADYDVQRRIYGLAALRAGATSVEVAHCFLRRPAELVSVRYAASDADRLEAQLAALAAPLLAGRFDVSRLPHVGLCATCPGRARLCSWDEASTLREGPSPILVRRVAAHATGTAAEQAVVQDA
jgi:hypothetical protein